MGYITDPSVIKVEPSGAVADELDAHKADKVTEKVVHGLRIESGTWIPVLSVADGYDFQIGEYHKIGNYVFLWFFIKINALSSSGSASITGNPFTPKNDAVYFNAISLSTGMNVAGSNLKVRIVARSGGNLDLYISDLDTLDRSIDVNDLTSNFKVGGEIAIRI